jgi:hypothetical protein
MRDPENKQPRTAQTRYQETVSQSRQGSEPRARQAEPAPTQVEPEVPFTIKPSITVQKGLARGGMSFTLLGHTQKESDRVVIKIPSQHDEAALKRFNAEIQNLKNLKHPSIVRMRGAGYAPIPFGSERITKKLPCLVMEYIEGQSLRQRIQSERVLPWSEVRSLLKDILEALDYLDKKKLCHLDVKPDNIVFDQKKGRWVLVDFGISRSLLEAASCLTMAADRLGSLAYMSPEQQGETSGEQRADSKVDIRSDIYSLGITVWEALLGTLPRPGTKFPSAVRGPREIPGDVDMLIEQMVAHSPLKRYQKPKLVAEALKQGATRLELRADRRRRWRRYRTSMMTAICVSAALGLGWYLGDCIVSQNAKATVAGEGSPTRAIQKLSAISGDQWFGWGRRYISARSRELAPRADDERRRNDEKFAALAQLPELLESDQQAKFNQVDAFLGLNQDILAPPQVSEGQLIRDRLLGAKIAADSRELEQKGDGKGALRLCEVALTTTKSLDTTAKIQTRIAEIVEKWSEKWLKEIRSRFETASQSAGGRALVKSLVAAEMAIETEIIRPLGRSSKMVDDARQEFDQQLWWILRDEAEQLCAKKQFLDARARAKEYASESRFKLHVSELNGLIDAIWLAEDNFEWQTVSNSARKNMLASSFPRAIQDIAAYRRKWLDTDREFFGKHRQEADSLEEEVYQQYFRTLSKKYLDSGAQNLSYERRYEQFKDEMDVWRQLNLGDTERYTKLSAILGHLVSKYVEELVESGGSKASERLAGIRFGQCLEPERVCLTELMARAKAAVHNHADLQSRWSFRWQLQQFPDQGVDGISRKRTIYRVAIDELALQLSDEYFSKLKGRNDANAVVTIVCGRVRDDAFDAVYQIKEFSAPVNAQTIHLPNSPVFYWDTAAVPMLRVQLRDADENDGWKFLYENRLAYSMEVDISAENFKHSSATELTWKNGSTGILRYTSD